MAQFCIHCGGGLEPGVRFCIACGQSVSGDAPAAAPSVPMTVPHHRSVWIWLGPLLGLLVAGGAVAAVLLLKKPADKQIAEKPAQQGTEKPGQTWKVSPNLGKKTTAKRDQSTPEKVFETMRQAIIAGDIGTLYDLLSSTSDIRKQMDQSRETLIPTISAEERERAFGREMSDEELNAMPARDFWIVILGRELTEKDRQGMKSVRPTFKHVTEDEASVSYEINGKNETIMIVREDGLWYLSPKVE